MKRDKRIADVAAAHNAALIEDYWRASIQMQKPRSVATVVITVAKR